MLPPTTADGKRLKYKARQWIDAERYDWVCFLDCDMLAQRNMDHLLDTHILSDILWQPEGKICQNAYNS
jgi:alpha-N-acetylglucosamine transferase